MVTSAKRTSEKAEGKVYTKEEALELIQAVAKDYANTLAYTVGKYLKERGSQKYVECLETVVNVLDFEFRSGTFKTEELHATHALAVWVERFAENDTEWARNAAKNLAHSIGHVRDALTAAEAGKFTPALIDCFQKVADNLRSEIPEREREAFKAGRDAWFKEEEGYRKNPGSRPRAVELPQALLSLFGDLPNRH